MRIQIFLLSTIPIRRHSHSTFWLRFQLRIFLSASLATFLLACNLTFTVSLLLKFLFVSLLTWLIISLIKIQHKAYISCTRLRMLQGIVLRTRSRFLVGVVIVPKMCHDHTMIMAHEITNQFPRARSSIIYHTVVCTQGTMHQHTLDS